MLNVIVFHCDYNSRYFKKKDFFYNSRLNVTVFSQNVVAAEL